MGSALLLLETNLAAKALIDPGGSQHSRDDQLQEAGDNPGGEQQEPSACQLGGELKYLVSGAD
jgi:hypothetical protein